MLEVGAGSGHHLPYVSKDFQQYVMTDVSEEMLNIARKKFCAEVSSDSLVIEKQDATSLNYPDDSFDRLIATHVLEHLPNPVSVLSEWNRVVRPDGIISIVLPCDPGFFGGWGDILGHGETRKNLVLPMTIYRLPSISTQYSIWLFLFSTTLSFWMSCSTQPESMRRI